MNRVVSLILTMALCSVYTTGSAQLNVVKPRVENLQNPIGLDVLRPTFSWQLVSEKRNTTQTAYEIIVASTTAAIEKGNADWKSGKISSDQSVLVQYKGPDLIAGKKYYWKVRVWDKAKAEHITKDKLP